MPSTRRFPGVEEGARAFSRHNLQVLYYPADHVWAVLAVHANFPLSVPHTDRTLSSFHELEASVIPRYSEPMTTEPDEQPTARALWRWTVPAAVIAAVSILLIWVAQSLPIICPAIYPAPPSCAPGARLGPALLGSAVLVALFVALLVTGAVLRPRRRDKALRILLIVLVVAAVVAPLWTLNGSGFALG